MVRVLNVFTTALTKWSRFESWLTQNIFLPIDFLSVWLISSVCLLLHGSHVQFPGGWIIFTHTPCGSVGKQMDSFSSSSSFFQPPNWQHNNNIYVFLLGTENTIGGHGSLAVYAILFFLIWSSECFSDNAILIQFVLTFCRKNNMLNYYQCPIEGLNPIEMPIRHSTNQPY